MMTEKSISEFLSEEYKEFAMYVIEGRAIPSVIDGFKPTQRKIIHIANQIWKTGNEKTLKVFQLSGKVASDCFYHHGDCLDPETEILMENGQIITIFDWFENYPEKKFNLISFDEENKKFVTGIGHSPRIGNISDVEYEIEMENGEIFRCTNNHPFLTQRGWIIAEELLEEDNIISFYRKYMKIKSIKKNILNEPKKFYDITVDEYHNFAIGKNSMIITHNSSLSNAIITMAQRFKNNAPLLEEEGQFGSLRSPQAGAPRYIGTKLSENFKLIYKDFELLDFKEEEGEVIEPNYFLPIVPTVLLNGSSGIAVGFASNILNRDIRSIIDACLKVLNGKNTGEIKPSLNGFTGDYIQDSDNHKRWIIRGKFVRSNTTTIKINELPPSMTYEKYEDILDKLVDDKVIVSYDDNCKDNIDYTIKFTRSDLEKLDDEKLIKLLKLEESSTEIYSTLDEKGKLKIFDRTEDIIKYFVEFRLSYYNVRKQYLLDKMNRELKILSNRGKFIKAILDNKLLVNNVSKIEIIKGIEELKLEMVDDSYDYLLRMPIYSLTKEMFDKLKSDFLEKKVEIKKMEKTDPKDMYVTDLNELKKKFK